MVVVFYLLPISKENITGLTRDETRPDIKAKSVRRNTRNLFFDILVKRTDANFHNHHH